MAVTLTSISTTNLSLTWQQPRVSEGLNKAQAVSPAGVVRGFHPVPGAADRTIEFEVDAVSGDSVISARAGSSTTAVLYRTTATVTVGGSGLALSTMYYIGVIVAYSTGVATTGTWRAYTQAEVTAGDHDADGALLICRVTTPASAGVILPQDIVFGDDLFWTESAGLNAGVTRGGGDVIFSIDFGAPVGVPITFGGGTASVDYAVLDSGFGSLKIQGPGDGSKGELVVDAGSFFALEGDSFVVAVTYRSEAFAGTISVQQIDTSFAPVRSESQDLPDSSSAFETVYLPFTASARGFVLFSLQMEGDNPAYADSLVVYRVRPNRENAGVAAPSAGSPTLPFGIASDGGNYWFTSGGSGPSLKSGAAGDGSKTLGIGDTSSPLGIDVSGAAILQKYIRFGTSGLALEAVSGSTTEVSLTDAAGTLSGLLRVLKAKATEMLLSGSTDSMLRATADGAEVVDTAGSTRRRFAAIGVDTDDVTSDALQVKAVAGTEASIRSLNTASAQAVLTWDDPGGEWLFAWQEGFDTSFGTGGIGGGEALIQLKLDGEHLGTRIPAMFPNLQGNGGVSSTAVFSTDTWELSFVLRDLEAGATYAPADGEQFYLDVRTERDLT